MFMTKTLKMCNKRFASMFLTMGVHLQKTLVFHQSAVSSIFLLMVLLHSLPPASGVASSYPPAMEVAAERPVHISPVDNVCGYYTRQRYCESYPDYSFVRSCFDSECEESCPHRTELPIQYDAFSVLSSGARLGNLGPDDDNYCIQKSSTERAPVLHEYQTSQYSVNFKAFGGGQGCYLDLDSGTLAHLALFDNWSRSFTFWIKPTSIATSSTILEITNNELDRVLRIGLLGNLTLIVEGDDQTLYRYTHPNWILPRNQWTFVAIQLFNTDLSIHFNGSHIYPSLYNIVLRRPAWAVKYRLGKSLQADVNDYFLGFLEDFQIIIASLTNREVQEVYLGNLEPTHVYSNCRCPSGYPKLRPDNQVYCIKNDGIVLPSTNPADTPSYDDQVGGEEYRINTRSYPPTFVNDRNGVSGTQWISTPGMETSSVSIDFDQQYEIVSVQVTLYSLLPSKLTLERHIQSDGVWKIWQYYAVDCLQSFGMSPIEQATWDDTVLCRNFTQGGSPIIYNNALIIFNVMDNRPGSQDDIMSDTLRSFAKSDAVRVNMTGHPYALNAWHRYHAIKNIAVYARCDCYGHGTMCDVTQSPYVCKCDPESYTTGTQCQHCIAGTWREKDDPRYPCRLCDCSTLGTIPGDTSCQDGNTGGQCGCKTYVTGYQCDTCLPRFFNLAASNPDGCEACNCNEIGTADLDAGCNERNGQCVCKERVEGRQCDTCTDGYYNLHLGNPHVCSACDCNPAGTIPGTSCDKITGQCQCKANVQGQRCDECKDRFWDLQEAHVDGCIECACSESVISDICHKYTGECDCRIKVIGRTCDQCIQGYSAISEHDFNGVGCTHPCFCNQYGTLSNYNNTCERTTGQCQCKSNVMGKKCDTCIDGTFGLSSSLPEGCQACVCDVRGTTDVLSPCYKQDGQCGCKQHVEGLQCDRCVKNYYNLSQENQDGCQSCNCYQPGVIPDSSCNQNNGRCECKPLSGDARASNYTCRPYVTDLNPKYGPESGGTFLVIKGGFLMDVVSVMLGSVLCQRDPQKSNDTVVTCVTESIMTGDPSTSNLTDVDLPLTLLTSNHLAIHSKFYFTYGINPIIHNVFPLSTIASGGLIITVAGDNLDTINEPNLNIYLVQNSNIATFSSVCLTVSKTQMECPTPGLALPGTDAFKHSAVVSASTTSASAPSTYRPTTKGYVRLSTSGITLPVKTTSSFLRPTTLGLAGIHQQITTTPTISRSQGLHLGQHESSLASPTGHMRAKRSADDEYGSEGGIDIYYGFLLDGYDKYKNMSEAKPDIGTLTVYKNPELNEFDGEDRIKLFRTYWPFNYRRIQIDGSRLDYATTAEMYTVQVGIEECKKIELSTNEISCSPPKTPPDPESQSHLDLPQVSVEVGNLLVVVGYLDYETSFWENLPFRYAVIAGLSALLLLLILCCLCCYCCCRKTEDEEDKHLYFEMDYGSNKQGHTNEYISAYDGSIGTVSTTYTTPLNDLLYLLPDDLQFKVQQCLIEPSRMQIGRIIGRGQFGRVHIGRLKDEYSGNTIDVAIKTLKETESSPRDVTYFLDEATMMKDFKHEHILNLIGVSIQDDKAYVVLPYMENGDLKTFISSEDNRMNVGELLNFAVQVADGMAYLSSQKFVHRDLAARNCMVDDLMTVKIADFGLSRDIYETEYYRDGEEKRPLPVKWMALESLQRGIYTSKSDAWSYGVLLWELTTRGCTPYPDVDNYDIRSYIENGYRMDKPDFAPPEIYEIMLECWDEQPERRPTFEEMAMRMTRLLTSQNASTMMRQSRKHDVRPLSFHAASMRLDVLP